MLVLALELVLEDDAADVGALFPNAFLFPQIRAIELDVVRQLTWPVHAGVEGLPVSVVAAAAMGFQEVMTAFRERQGALAAVQFDELGEPFVAQMPQVWLPPVDRLVTGIAEVAFGHDPKRTDGGKYVRNSGVLLHGTGPDGETGSLSQRFVLRRRNGTLGNVQRLGKLADHIRQAHEDTEKLRITGDKLTRRFNRIERVELDQPGQVLSLEESLADASQEDEAGHEESRP